MGDLEPGEREFLDTPGEASLLHLERDLNPNRSYNMVTFKCLLTAIGGTKDGVRMEWSPEEIARIFKTYYLEHPDHLDDYPDLARYKQPDQFPISRVVTHIKKNPLHFLSNTDDKFCVLDLDRDRFLLKQEVHPYWRDRFFREFVEDRVEYCLKRYSYRRTDVIEDQVTKVDEVVVRCLTR